MGNISVNEQNDDIIKIVVNDYILFKLRRVKKYNHILQVAKEAKMSAQQREMLEFLKNATKEHPLDLRTAFDLGNEKKKDVYQEYLSLASDGLINSDKRGAWITDEGKKALQ